MKLHITHTMLRAVAGLVTAVTVLASCSATEEPVPPEEQPEYGTSEGRVVLFYVAVENTLAGFGNEDAREVLAGARYMGSKDHALILIDDLQKPRLYDITFKDRNTPMADLKPIISYDEDFDSCSPEVFGDILQFVRQNYPSPSYGLVMESHASGWLTPRPASAGAQPADYSQAWGAKSRSADTRRRSFGFDNGQNSHTDSGSQLSVDDIRDQILRFGRFDFILFDACFMQNIEVAYQLRNCARYIIGSPAEIPAYGAPYDTMLKPMFSDSAYVEDMVRTYRDSYTDDPLYGVLLSAIDCSRLEQVAGATAAYVHAYKQTLLSMNYDGVLDYLRWDRYYMHDYSDYYDMRSIMRTALSQADYEAWYTVYSRLFVCQFYTDYWYSSFNRSRYNSVVPDHYSGLSMHVPLEKYATRNKWFAPAYYATDWAQAVWGDPAAHI